MRIKVDRTLCAGHALCASRAPDVYALDEEGFCASDGAIVAKGKEKDAEVGAAVCPERAITLIEE